jgi:hypothetical protein
VISQAVRALHPLWLITRHAFLFMLLFPSHTPLVAQLHGRSRDAQAGAVTVKPVPDSLLSPVWVLTSEKPRAGQTVEAWLVVPGFSGVDSGATVTLLTPSGGRIWLRPAGASCSAAEPADQLIAPGGLSRDTILFACVRPESKGSVRLVAVRRALQAAGAQQRIAVSDPLTVASRLSLSPGALAVATALIGFFTGILAHILQQLWDRHQEGKRSVKELEAVTTRSVVPEFSENKRRLEAYLGSGGGMPPDLLVAGYNELLGDQGALAFLEEPKRRTYLHALYAVYDEVNQYTDLKNSPNPPAASVAAAARRVLGRLKRPLASVP